MRIKFGAEGSSSRGENDFSAKSKRDRRLHLFHSERIFSISLSEHFPSASPDVNLPHRSNMIMRDILAGSHRYTT